MRETASLSPVSALQSADDELFIKTSTYTNHILHSFLPPLSTASQSYSLRRRTHSHQLPGHSTYL